MAKVPYAFNTKDYRSSVSDTLDMVSLQTVMQEKLGTVIPIEFNDGYDVHRFSSCNDGKNDAFYFAHQYPNGLKVVSFGTWRDRSKDYTWMSKEDSELSDEDRKFIDTFSKEEKEKREQEHKFASWEAEKHVLESPRGDAGNTPYAKKKNISKALCMPLFPTTADKQAIIVPVYRFDAGKHVYISAYQELWPQKKYNQKGGNFTGGWYLFGNGLPTANDLVYVCEGFATGVSIYEATGKHTLCVFSCGQYKNVLSAWYRARGLKENFLIIADNDKKKEGEDMGAGEKAAKETGITYKVCPSMNTGSTDANDFVNDGYNLSLWLQSGEIKESGTKVASWIHDGNVIFDKMEPIRWLLKHWLPADGVSTIYGPSNSGKSFFALDLMLHIATGVGDGMYRGIKMHYAPVLYLCGEGARGAKIRMLAWCKEHGVTDLSNFYMADSPKDIDKLADRDFIIDQITNLDQKPKMIFIDTLNRFFSGNENDAQEMRNFLNSLSEISKRFDCGFCIVHHSGVSTEAQNRVRGSSALKAAIDTEIKISQRKKDGHTYVIAEQTKQRDDKYQEPMVFRFKDVILEELYDEDDPEPVSTAIIEPEGDEKTITEILSEDSAKHLKNNSAKQMKIKEEYQQKIDEKTKEMKNRENQLMAIDFVSAYNNFYGRVDANGNHFLRSDEFKKWLRDFSTRMENRSSKTDQQKKKWADNQMSSQCGIMFKMTSEGLVAAYDFTSEELEEMGLSFKPGDASIPKKIIVVDEELRANLYPPTSEENIDF